MTSRAVQAPPTQHADVDWQVPPAGHEATPPSTEHSRAQTAPVMQRRPVSQTPPVQQVIPDLPHSVPPSPLLAGPQVPFVPP